MSSLFLFEEFGISLHLFVHGSRNVGSRKIGVHSPFWEHHGILRFLSFVYKTIEKIAVYKESRGPPYSVHKYLSYDGENEERDE